MNIKERVAMRTFHAELTDTFAGQANYSWVHRVSFRMPENASDLAIVRRAKRELNHDTRTRTENDGNMLTLRSVGENTVAFVTWD